MVSEISKSQKGKNCIILHIQGTESSQIESRIGSCQGLEAEGGGNGKLYNGYKMSVLQDKKVLKIHCITV